MTITSAFYYHFEMYPTLTSDTVDSCSKGSFSSQNVMTSLLLHSESNNKVSDVISCLFESVGGLCRR